MQTEELLEYLDHTATASPWLRSLKVTNLERAHRNLVGMADAGITIDLLAAIGGQLSTCLPRSSDPDMALNNLERFVCASRNPLALATLIERDTEALPILIQIFSTSQHLSDVIVNDPESYDLLRITEGQPVGRQVLVDEILSEMEALIDLKEAGFVLRRFKRRETLRIAYGDIIRGQELEVVTRQISYLADAICEAVVFGAQRDIQRKHGIPLDEDGKPARFVVLGLGKLGGTELNYSSDIDLMFLYDVDGKTDGARAITNLEFFSQVAQRICKVLSESTELGAVYRVDLRLRPQGKQGAAVISQESVMRYYDILGRTWERQAFLKVRPVAGDLDFGQEFLVGLEPWIYRRNLSRTDIIGIKALKRRIETRCHREGHDARDVKTGHGGIRDIEFVIQFLQLLHGGELRAVRTGNTLEAIVALEQVGCLTMQERFLLEKHYRLLRRIEHRLQILFDLQTHTLPTDSEELTKVARRIGYTDDKRGTAFDVFQADYRQATQLNRKILDHLLHDAFGDEEKTEPEVDLILDPNPIDETIGEVLGKYDFQQVSAAYRNLTSLATENIVFLSTRRCRHFLASIAPHLLQAVAATPDPDSTLVNLVKVSDSLGGKGVLWELFSFNPPSARLYVRLCASSPYLSNILMSNPGMIDELMDSLVLDRLPSLATLNATLSDLCAGAEDIELILHNFKGSQHLHVGVRDILGKEDLESTTGVLADIAEVCLQQLTMNAYHKLTKKFGEPMRSDGKESDRPCQLVTLAMGKLGGREPNYHSDLDVIFLYESEGNTVHRGRGRHGLRTTTNQHFFSELGQHIIKSATQMGSHGRLYEVDARLRPTGRSGTLAVSFQEFSRYFSEGQGQLWERQALCKARPISGSEASRIQAMELVRQAITEPRWDRAFATEIDHMRKRLEQTASTRNLKRGPGGTVDIEFVVQMLQLRYAQESSAILVPGTLEALSQLNSCGYLGQEDHEFLSRGYRFLRGVEARLRLMNTVARHDLPDDPVDQAKLAYLLRYDTHEKLVSDCVEIRVETRRRYERILNAVASE